MKTLTEAKSYVHDNKFSKDGVICPCCGTKAKVWKKPMISTAVASLVCLVSMYKGDPIHFDKFTVLAKDRNFSQLVNWNLIVPAINKDGFKRSSGKWHPTQAGIDFVLKKIKIPRYVFTFNNQIIDISDETIGVEEVLGIKFSYKELLNTFATKPFNHPPIKNLNTLIANQGAMR